MKTRRQQATLLALLLALATSLTLTAPAHAAVSSWVVQGTVTGVGYQGGPVAGARVLLISGDCIILDAADTCFEATTTTDASGHYVFPHVTPDVGQNGQAYLLEVHKAGWPDGTLEVPQGQDATKDLSIARSFRCGALLQGDPLGSGLLRASASIAPPSPNATMVINWYRTVAGTTPASVPDLDVVVQTGSATTYQPTSVDAGHLIYVVATADDGVTFIDQCETADVSALAPPVVVPVPAPAAALVPVSGAPALTGRAQVGKVLTASPGVVPAGTTVAYQWFRITRAGKAHRLVVTPIRGATGKTYRARAKDRRSKVFARMVLTHTGFTPRTVSTRPVRIH